MPLESRLPEGPLGPTVELASWVAGSDYAILPQQVVHEAKRTALNFLGVAIGGSPHPAVVRSLAVSTAVGGPPACTILGRAERTDPLFAALINGISSHVLDFDDTHAPTILHPGGAVLPAPLALSEWRPGSGTDLLIALVVGVEVACRAGLAVFPAHYDQGWHITGTAGSIGAAAAAARYLKLDRMRTAYALGLGATQAAGFQEMFGTMAKPFHVGRAAQSGVLAGLLGEQAFTSSTSALEAERGWCHVSSPKVQMGQLTAGLGETWEILRNTYKPFACGVVTHPAIDGMLRLQRQRPTVPSEVESIRVSVHRRVLEICGNAEPRTGLEGKFSIYHCCAVALVDGAAGEAQFSDARVLDPEVVQVRLRLTVTVDETLGPEQAIVAIKLRDGSQLSERVDSALGTLRNPMSDADLEAKFEALVTPVLGAGQAAELLGMAWRLEDVALVHDLMRLCRPGRAC